LVTKKGDPEHRLPRMSPRLQLAFATARATKIARNFVVPVLELLIAFLLAIFQDQDRAAIQYA
jgi:hypothetical protein